MKALIETACAGSAILLFYVMLTAVIAPQQAAADLHKCDGMWTNKPCNGEVAETLKEGEGSRISRMGSDSAYANAASNAAAGGHAQAVGSEPLAPRLEVIRNLRKMNDEFKKKGGVTLARQDIDALRKVCEDLSRPYTECKQGFDENSGKLTALNQQKEKD